MGFQSDINRVVAAGTAAAIAVKKGLSGEEPKADEVHTSPENVNTFNDTKPEKGTTPPPSFKIRVAPEVSREEANLQAILKVNNRKEQQDAIKKRFEEIKNKFKEVKVNE